MFGPPSGVWPPVALAMLVPLAPADLSVEERVAAQVSREAALAMVRRLVGLGPRTGGTESGHRAAEMVSEAMRSTGLAVETIEDPALDTWEAVAWSVKLGARPLASAWPYGRSPSLSETTVPLVPEGARDRTDGGADPWKGAAVLTARPIASVLAEAAKAGAAAVLTYHPADPNRFQDWAPILDIPGRGGEARPPAFGLSYRDGLRLKQEIEEGRSPTVTLSLQSRVGRGRPRTVAGSLSGAGPRANRQVILCAHGDSDSGGPGADDNASGVAAVIEVARALSWARAEGLLPDDRPTVRFIVWGAEYHSSEAYVVSRRDEMRRTLAVLNYDQVGTGATRDAIYIEGNDIPANERLLRVLEQVAADHAAKVGFWTEYTTTPAMGGTDAFAFLPKRYHGSGLTDEAIAATTIFTSAWDEVRLLPQTPGWTSKGWPEKGEVSVDYSAFYHSSGDTPDRTTEAEPYNIERAARLAALGILRLMRPE